MEFRTELVVIRHEILTSLSLSHGQGKTRLFWLLTPFRQQMIRWWTSVPTVKPLCRSCEEKNLKVSRVVFCFVFFLEGGGGEGPLQIWVASEIQNCSKASYWMREEIWHLWLLEQEAKCSAVERAHLRGLTVFHVLPLWEGAFPSGQNWRDMSCQTKGGEEYSVEWGQTGGCVYCL